MKIYYKYSLFLILAFITAPCLSLTQQSYWQCLSHDSMNMHWTVTSTYQKAALNLSYDQCKKASTNPKSCSMTVNECRYFRDGRDTTPMWQCTSIDRQAEAWKSTAYPSRDDAALGAQDYCKANSAVPETCFINTITCVNINDDLDF